MLTPEYFENKEDRMLEMFRELEMFLLEDVSKRLLKAGEMSGTADRNIWKTMQLGVQQEEILKQLSALTGKTTKELRNLLEDAVMTSWESDRAILEKMGVATASPLENPDFMRVINAQLKKSKGELYNLTRSTMRQAQKDLIQLLDQADMRVASGAQSYSSAICQILDEYAGRGIKVEYARRSISLEAAVRMCVVTSMNQTTAQLTNAYIEEAAAEYVLVSAHAGARYDPKHPNDYHSHDHWQGKVYKIQGSEEGYPNLLEETGYDIRDGVGIVVEPEGLHGYNCRHSHQPWIKGLRNPYVDENGNLKIDTEESRKLYDLKQKQRAMERSVRKTKRQLLEKQTQIDLVAEMDVKPLLQADYDRLAYKLREQNKAYNSFCEENELTKDTDRLKVAGFKKKQASAANGRATAYQNAEEKVLQVRSGTQKMKPAPIFEHKPAEIDYRAEKVTFKDLQSWKKSIGKVTDDEYSIISGMNDAGYIRNANAYKINKAMREGTVSELSDASKKTIETLKEVINKNESEMDAVLIRKVDRDYLKNVFGIDHKNLSDVIEELNSKKVGEIITEKGFVSTSYKEAKNLNNNDDVWLDIYAPKGTKMFLTKNREESEIILQAGTKFEFKGATLTDDNKIKLLVDVKNSTDSVKPLENTAKDSKIDLDLQFFAKKHKPKKVPNDDPLWDSLVKGDVKQQMEDGIFEWEHGGYDYLIEFKDKYTYDILSKKKKPNIHE